MARFDALFFDMDGTLVENGVLMPAAFQEGSATARIKMKKVAGVGSAPSRYR